MYYALNECNEHTLSRNKRRSKKKPNHKRLPQSSNQKCRGTTDVRRDPIVGM